MLFDVAFQRARFGKALLSNFGLVKLGRPNSRRDTNYFYPKYMFEHKTFMFWKTQIFERPAFTISTL